MDEAAQAELSAFQAQVGRKGTSDLLGPSEVETS
jgi:hypothetical protein